VTSSTLVNNVATSGRGSVSDWTLTPPGAVSVVGESAQDITSKGGACAYCTACTLSGNTGGTRADFTTLASYLAATVPSPTSSARRLGALPRTSVDTGVAPQGLALVAAAAVDYFGNTTAATVAAIASGVSVDAASPTNAASTVARGGSAFFRSGNAGFPHLVVTV